MIAEDHRVQSLLKRVEKLEARNRRANQGFAVLALALGCLLLMGQARPPRTLEAQEFVLKDPSGNRRATLRNGPDGALLTLWDANGKLRIGISAAFILVDSSGRTKATLDEQSGYPSLMLYGEKMEKRIMLATTPDGGNLLSLLGGRPGVGATLFADSTGASLQLTDHAGFQASFGRSALEAPLTGSKTTTSAAYIGLSSTKEGKILWQAP